MIPETLNDLLAELERRGVTVVAQGDQLRLRGPLHDCATLVEALKTRKEEFLSRLSPFAPDVPGSAAPLIDATTAPFIVVSKLGFADMLDPDRFMDRSDVFDRMISATEDHFWNPLDSRYIDLSVPFDVDATPMISEEEFVCFLTPSVQARLADPVARIRFINRTVWIRFSTLLHGEQGALSLSASLCNLLKDQGAQEFAANQVREEARHVTGFARYIKARWGRPAPCPPALKAFLTEIIECDDVTRKIIGMQIIVEGLAMGSLGSLYKRLRDPAGRRLLQLVMTDESFHHKFGKLWAETSMPTVTPADLERLDAWIAHCLKDFIVKMNPPLELHLLAHDFGLDPMVVSREIQALPVSQRRDATGLGSQEVFRTLISTLLKAGLLSPRLQTTYSFYLQHSDQSQLDDDHTMIVSEGLAYLHEVNENLRQASRTAAE